MTPRRIRSPCRAGRRPLLSLVGLSVVAGLTSGCSDNPLDVQVPDITGDWTFVEEWSNAGIGIACENSGSLSIEQDGADFSGSFSQAGTCTNRSGDRFDDSAAGEIRVGQVQGDVAGFTAANCHYRATISGTPPDLLSGSVRCTLSAGSGGAIVRFAGTWSANLELIAPR